MPEFTFDEVNEQQALQALMPPPPPASPPASQGSAEFSIEEVESQQPAVMSQTEPEPEGAGVGNAILRGLMLGMRAPGTGDPDYQAPTNENFVKPDWAPEGISDESYAAQREERFPRVGADSLPGPVNAQERMAQGIASAAPATAAAVALTGPFMGLGALGAAGEFGLGMLGATASETVRESGGGTGAQLGADVLASAVAPSATMGVLGRMGMRQIPKASMSSTKSVAAQLKKQGYKVKPTDVYRAGQNIRGNIATGVTEPNKYVDRVRQNIDQVIDEGDKAAGVRSIADVIDQGEDTASALPSLAQAAGEAGGFGLTGQELRYAKHDPAYRASALGRRLDTIEDHQGKFEGITPYGDYPGAQTAFTLARQEAIDEADRLWALVPTADMPTPSTSSLKAAVNRIRNQSDAGAKWMPGEADTILEYGDTITARELQSLRSELLMSKRLAERFGASDASIRRLGKVKQLLGAVDELELATYPVIQSTKLKAARAATARQKDIFNPRRNAIEAISERAESKHLMRRIRAAKDPLDEARNLKAALGGSEEGMAGIRGTIFNDIFGENIGDKSVRAMQNNIENNRDVYEVFYEPEQLQLLEAYVNKWGMVTSGKTATASQALSTGTGYEMIDLIQAMKAGRSVSGMVGQFTQWGFKRLTGGSQQEAALIKLASQDIRIAKMLLDVPSPDKLPAMRSLWNGAMDITSDVAKQSAKRSPGAEFRSEQMIRD